MRSTGSARQRCFAGYHGTDHYAMRCAPDRGVARVSTNLPVASTCPRMTILKPKAAEPDAPIMHRVDGNTVELVSYNWLELALRFLARPFADAWHHRDLITAILRRELRERFRGSMAGWIWAITAPLISLVTYTIVFS